jgi:predicted nicotinamide N-methyase
MIVYTTQTFEFNNRELLLAIPQEKALKEWYEQNKATHSFPFWAKVWPAAKALAQFISSNHELVAGKKVLEIAGGLGLPSLVAAKFSREVICTDAIKEAISFINSSIKLNSLINITAKVYNWNESATSSNADVLLMSDVNYNPDDFPQLFAFIQAQMQKPITILLSTPQRLMAKPFIEALQPFIFQQQELFIQEEEVMCSVFVLKPVISR